MNFVIKFLFLLLQILVSFSVIEINQSWSISLFVYIKRI